MIFHTTVGFLLLIHLL